MIIRSSNVFLLIISLFTLTVSCHQSETQSTAEDSSHTYSPQPTTSPRTNENATSGEIYISVDESLQPVIQAETETFEALYPNATIHPLYMPGEEAIQAMLVSDSIRLAVVTRKLKRNEEQLLVQKTIPPEYAEVAREGIALLAHQENPVSNFSQEQLLQILSGEISHWDQLNSNFNQKQKKIVLVFDNAKSGIIAFLRDSILAGKTFAPELYALKRSEEVLDYVSKNPNSLGFIGVSWVSDIDNQDVKAWREK
ncbi:MAG: substrate-binding domain-containing protein [Bacteroidia bacterium]